MNTLFQAKDTPPKDILHFVSDVVAAYVSNNTLAPPEVPDLIQIVYNTLAGLGGARSIVSERPDPAVPIKKSITEDHVICLEDGKKLKMLKRHLKTAYNMTPEQYRERWALSADYPMVAPSYAKKRSNLAKTNGLGRSRTRVSKKNHHTQES